MGGTRAQISAAAALIAIVMAPWIASVRAQEIEPRAYSNAPVGVNFLIGGYAYTRGGVPTDASLPITNARLARTGDNYDLLGIAWQYRWGGGL